jgi:hypothetical protein
MAKGPLVSSYVVQPQRKAFDGYECSIEYPMSTMQNVTDVTDQKERSLLLDDGV